MTIWAIADLHLSFGVQNKQMDVFGGAWVNHATKLEQRWRELICEDDLVLIAGDISWALHLADALVDLNWIDRLPGKKVLIKGNHDLWWKSASKVRSVLPPSLHIISNDAFLFNDIAIGGTRLWENPEISYNEHIIFRSTDGVKMRVKAPTQQERLQDEKVYQNELHRLAFSIEAMDPAAQKRIVLVHYPPAGPQHRDSAVMRLLQSKGIDLCLFGHLHNLQPDAPVNFAYNGVRVLCTACDYLNFTPLKIEL